LERQKYSSSDFLFENAMAYTFYTVSESFDIPAGESKNIIKIKTWRELYAA